MQSHYHESFTDPAIFTMNATFEVESTLTDRYQTTVPEMIRRALKLGKRDKVHYSIRPDGVIVLTRAVVGTVDRKNGVRH
jgi:antitoxin PrlF